MFTSAPHPELGRRRLVGLVVSVVLTGCLVGIYLALSARNHRPEDSVPVASPPARNTIAPSGESTRRSIAPRPLTGISDPEAFAEAVARALFDWDTAAPNPRSEYAGRLLVVADPTGAESPALVADVASYLPTDEAWADLKPYYTRQWIEIESITVPDLWPQAVSEAGPGGFAPGTRAYTIEGARHRTGVWEGDDVTAAHEVAFTVFIVCEPTYPSCHLLRLSRLDEPLQ